MTLAERLGDSTRHDVPVREIDERRKDANALAELERTALALREWLEMHSCADTHDLCKAIDAVRARLLARGQARQTK